MNMLSAIVVYAVLAVLLAVAAGVVYFSIRDRRLVDDPLARLRSEIKKGIAYEDEFVEVYFKVIRDGGFMGEFGANKEEAAKLLTTMIDESKGHKNLLENVMANLK